MCKHCQTVESRFIDNELDELTLYYTPCNNAYLSENIGRKGIRWFLILNDDIYDELEYGGICDVTHCPWCGRKLK